MAGKLTVGIDLGTSSCSVGIIRDEQFSIFKDDKGNETTPSYVAFTESGRLIGQEAKDQVTINPKNTVYGIKRLIGKHHSKVMEEGRKLKLPFQTSLLHNSNSHIAVEYKRRNKLLEPKQVSAMLLVKMRKIAERNLGQNVHGAVISVPANFNSYQRQATVDAATIAGFRTVNLINEPTASAFAFSSELKCEKYRNVLIADFGGGFFSLTVARVKSYDVQILASCAEEFGGLNIDQQLFDRFAKEISANLLSDVGNQRCTERLKQACEAAKKDLSHSSSRIHLTNFIDGKDVHLKVTKSDFITEVSASVGNMFQIATQKVLREACLWNSRIEDIVFVGKCWNISYFQESFLSLFSEKNRPSIHNLTNSVLHGAAIQAVSRTINFRLEDTIRSVEIHRKHGARMLSLVPNALSQRQEWIDLEESVECNVIEVVRNIRHLRENNTIGKIEVGPRKGYNFFATTAACGQFYADANGIIQGGLENKRAKFIILNLFHFSHRIDTLLSQEVQFQADEIEAQKLEEELRHLEKQCLETRRLVRNCNNLPLEMKERFDRRIEETLRWIDDNPGAMEVESRSKKLEIQKIYDEAQESEKSMVNGKCQRKGQENSGHQVNSKGSLQSQVSISRKNNRCNSVLSQIAGSSKYSDNAQKEKLLHLSDKERQEIKATLNGKQEEQRNDSPSECKEKGVNEFIDQNLGSDKQKEVKNKNSATVCSRILSSSRISIEEKEISEKNENKNGTSDKLKDKPYLSSEKEQTPLGTRTKSTNSAMKGSNISNDYNNSSSPADGRSASNSSSSDRDLISSSQKVISEPHVDPSASATARGNTSAKSPSLQNEKNHVTDVNQNYNGDAVPSEPQKCDSKRISEQKDLEGVKEVQSIKREGYLDGSGSERSCSSESYSTASKPRHVKGKCIKLKNDFIAYLLMDKASSYCYKAYSQFFLYSI